MKSKVDESALTPLQIYLHRLSEFKKFYLTLVILSATAIGVGIVIAILSNIFIGIALVLLSASAYIYFSFDEAKSKLGICCKNTNGHIELTRLLCTYGDCIAIPSRFMYADVTHIADGALTSKKNASLEALYIPKSIEHIGKDIFAQDAHGIVIYYEGSRTEFECIECLSDLSGHEIIFDTEMPRWVKSPEAEKEAGGQN